MSAKPDEAHGYTYTTASERATAKKVDLITLPISVDGTNCRNCKFYEKPSDIASLCIHPQIMLPVTFRQCCALWDHKDVLRSF
jgi:hypothetical protein